MIYAMTVYHHLLFLQDFCYAADPDTFNVMDVINMCVTVIAYAPDSFRSTQMLVGRHFS